MMTPFITIGLQSALSMTIFSLLALQYIVPRLSKLKLKQALIPFLWINAFRYLPLILFAPGQVSSAIPESVSTVVAYGDLVAGLLALAAVLLLSYNKSGGMAVARVFLLVGTVDSIYGVFTAISAEVYQFPLGFSWVVVTFFVPLIFVSEALMIYQLFTNHND